MNNSLLTFAKSLLETLKKEGGILLISVEEPHSLEKTLKKLCEEKIYHFWDPSSPYGLITIGYLGHIAWILGSENKVIKKFKTPVEEDFGKMLSSSQIFSPILRNFKEKY